MVNFSRKKGGRYIGQGTYGCTFTDPPLKCKGQSARNSRKVISKLMDRSAAGEEYIVNTLWESIDPEQKYFVWADKYCRVDATNIKPSDEMSKCSVDFQDTLQSRRLLMYPYGGVDLNKLRPNAKNYKNFFKGFANLFEGIKVAHDNNLTHCDIKEPNIVALVEEDKILIRYIDFGLQVVTDEFDRDDKAHTIFYNLYLYWPFETAFYDGKLMKTIINDNYKNFYTDIVTSRPYNFTHKNYFDKNWEEKDVSEFSAMLKKIDFSDMPSFFKRIDIYSLGLTLNIIIERYFGHVLGLNRDNNDEVKVYLYDQSKKFISQLKESDFKTVEEFNFHKNISQHVTGPMLLLTQKMMSLIPSDRPTAEQALNEYKKLFGAFDTYLKKKDVYQGLKDTNIFDKDALGDKPSQETPVANVKRTSVKRASPKSSSVKAASVKGASPKPPSVKPASVKVASVKPASVKSKTVKRVNTARSNNKGVAALPTGVPNTSSELKEIYKKSSLYPDESSELIKIVRAIGSKIDFSGKTKVKVVNEIIRRAKYIYNVNLSFK